ncbi:MAG: hypothetical protein JSS66_12410 [Armatimonadetes bacterium]|nr:hypothetical protein [Armatimonadota bacterium]
MKRNLLFAGSGLLLAALAVPLFFGPSDRQLIAQALQDSCQASREGRPGGVMDYLSSSMRYNGEPIGDRREVARYIKQTRPEVVILNPTPVINGQTATVVSPVEVKISIGPMPVSMRLENVRITLSRETGFKWLVVPAPKWRITEIKADEIDVSQWLSQ